MYRSNTVACPFIILVGILVQSVSDSALAETVISTKTREEELAAVQAVQNAPKVQLNERKVMAYTTGKAAGQKFDYQLSGPAVNDPAKKYPLVVISGGLRTDPFRMTANQVEYPCFVVNFNHPRGGPEQKIKGEWKLIAAAQAKELVEVLVKTHNIDEDRVYITGMSADGGVAWQAAVDSPKTFAAIVPSYATCSELEKAPLLVVHKVAVWVFHGAASNLVSTTQGNGPRAWVAALEKAGGAPKYTEYKNLGHTEMGFCDPELLPWLFAQKRK